MTVVLNYSSELLSIIITDTRVTYYDYDGNISHNDDNKIKLVNLGDNGLGWAAGSGFGQFLDFFKDRLTNAIIKTPIEIENIFIEVVKEVEEKFPNSSHEINKSIACVSWKGEYPQIGYLTTAVNEEEPMSMADLNRIEIFYPTDYGIEDKKSIEGKYEMEIEGSGDLTRILHTMLQIFNEISQSSSWVSNKCDIGIQLLDGQKIKISEDIENILRLSEEGRVMSTATLY